MKKIVATLLLTVTVLSGLIFIIRETAKQTAPITITSTDSGSRDAKTYTISTTDIQLLIKTPVGH